MLQDLITDFNMKCIISLDHGDYKLWELVQRLAHDVEVAERHKGI